MLCLLSKDTKRTNFLNIKESNSEEYLGIYTV